MLSLPIGDLTRSANDLKFGWLDFCASTGFCTDIGEDVACRLRGLLNGIPVEPEKDRGPSL